MFISVIIPTLNESGLIASAIESAQAAGADEIIVCDGGSTDDTRAHAAALGCTVINCQPGRGQQMASGAKQAVGDVLVFLHADSELAEQCLNQIRESRQCQGSPECQTEAAVSGGTSTVCVAWGCFEHSIAAAGAKYRWLERGNLWRARRRKMIYGDQVQWMNRTAYDTVGGFAPIPIMEDVGMSDRLRKLADPIILPGPVTISPRHWQSKGVVWSTIRNWGLYSLYRCGVSAERIQKLYR